MADGVGRQFGGVLFGPYIKEIAEEAAVDNRIDVLFFSIAPGSLPPFIITFSTIISAIVLPLLGAVADRTSRKKDLLAGFAWAGAAFAALLFFVTGDNWQLGVFTFIAANLCFAAAAVFNDAILPLISTEAERDRVSSRGWAFGYAGGGLLLALNFVIVSFYETFGITEGMAVRMIADQSEVAEATVRSQVKAILKKLDVNTQMAAVALYENLLNDSTSADIGFGPPWADSGAGG